MEEFESDEEDICYFVIDSKNHQKLAKIPFQGAKSRLIEFGKRINNSQYILKSYGDSCSTSIEIFEYNLSTKKLSLMDSAGVNICVEPSPDTNKCNQIYLNNKFRDYKPECFKNIIDYYKYIQAEKQNQPYYDIMKKYTLPKS